MTFFILLLSYSLDCRAQAVNVSQNRQESDAAFVERITGQKISSYFDAENRNPKDDKSWKAPPVSQIGRTTSLLKGHETLVSFTRSPQSDPDSPTADDAVEADIDLNVFVKMAGEKYLWLKQPAACETEGGEASLRAFFYANVKGAMDIGAICGWDDAHQSECASNDEVRFFKVSQKGILAVPMKQFYKLFYKKAPNGCTLSKFESVRDIKNILRNLMPSPQSK